MSKGSDAARTAHRWRKIQDVQMASEESEQGEDEKKQGYSELEIIVEGFQEEVTWVRSGPHIWKDTLRALPVSYGEGSRAESSYLR